MANDLPDTADTRLRWYSGAPPHGRTADWESLYRDLFQADNDMIVMLDAEGNILEINRRAESLTGFTHDDLVRRNVLHDLVVPEDRATVLQVLQDLEAGQSRVFQVRWRAKDGSILFFEGSSSARFSEDGRFLSTRCILRDMTDRIRAEQQLRAKQAELLHMARVSDVGEAAIAITHELSEPVSAISHFVQGAIRRLQRGDRDIGELLTALEDIRVESDRASQIIRHLRSYVRKREPHRSTSHINAIVQDALRMLDAELRMRGTLLRARLADDLPPVSVDCVQIQQCVMNLIRNALDAMAERPAGERELTLTTKRSTDGCVEVEISDTGTGIADGTADRIFEPFFTTRDNGLGMGLAICRSIIEAHGGRIEAEPNAALGTTFRFALLPIA